MSDKFKSFCPAEEKQKNSDSENCPFCFGFGWRYLPASEVIYEEGKPARLQWTYRKIRCAICFVRDLENGIIAK